MKTITYLLVAVIFSLTAKAQNDSLTIPNMSIELKREKAIRSHVFFTYIAIVDARKKGETAYDLGQFYGKSLGLTWSPVKDKGLIAYAEWLTAYVTLFKDHKIEILYNTNNTLRFRMKDIGEEYIDYWSKKYKSEEWVTVGEYFNFLKGFFIATSNYVGFEAESKVKEGWLYLKIYQSHKNINSNGIDQFENHLASQMVIKGEGEEIKYFNIYDRMKYYNVPGVSIALINNGKIEWAKGYGYFSNEGVNKIDTNTLFQAASISKPLTALATLELVEKGRFKLDNDVNSYLKDWKLPANKFTKQREVTLRLLLTHTAGIRPGGYDSTYNPKQLPSIIEILEGKALAEPAPAIVDTTPGTTWQYSNAGYMVLQKAIMDNTENDFASYMNKHILSKIGMKNSTFRQPLPKEYFKCASYGNKGSGTVIINKWNTYPQLAAAGLWTTPSDLARFAIEIQNSYQGKSNKIISQNMTKQMLTKGLGSWGLGFCIDGQTDSLSFSHGGSNEGFRCNLFSFASLGKGIVIMTNSDNGEQLYNEILRSASIVYNWNKYTPVVKTVIDLDTISLKKYVGTYQLQPGAEVDFTIKDNKLYGRNSWDNYSYPIYAESEIKFFEIKLPLEIKFDINQTKEVIGADIKNMDKKYYFKKIK